MPSALRCSVCSRVIRARRKINCSSCEGVYHVKCWKSSTNISIATERATSGWQCRNCNGEIGTEPVEHGAIRQETERIYTAQALNDLFTDEVMTTEEDLEYTPFANVRDKYFDSSDINFTFEQLKISKTKFLMTMCINIRSLNNFI